MLGRNTNGNNFFNLCSSCCFVLKNVRAKGDCQESLKNAGRLVSTGFRTSFAQLKNGLSMSMVAEMDTKWTLLGPVFRTNGKIEKCTSIAHTRAAAMRARTMEHLRSTFGLSLRLLSRALSRAGRPSLRRLAAGHRERSPREVISTSDKPCRVNQSSIIN